MTKFNIFLENIYPEYAIDEVKIHSDIVKMTECIFQEKSIMLKFHLEKI